MDVSTPSFLTPPGVTPPGSRLSRCAAPLLALSFLYAARAPAQALSAAAELPEAPSAQVTPPAAPAFQGTARVEGSVQDTQGGPVPDATVTLAAAGILGDRSVTSAQDGTFAFTALPAGQYRLIVSAQGLEPYTSGEFVVHAGATVAQPPIALKFSTSTSINVVATPDQIAIAQVHEEEKQRVFGVFPNFYTSYIWNAQPLPASQKYKLALRTMVDPLGFLIVAGVAGAEQFNGTFPGYGPGIEGYGKRYGAALADSTTSRIVGYAFLPAVLHQDPRYFYQGSGGWRSRTAHALSSTFVARGDNGRDQPNYSHLAGSLVAGAVSNAYHPESSRGVRNTFQTFGITVTANLLGNLFREFVLRGFVPSVPDYANGKR
ncbi:MAG: carboxypeptidase regulatory-like domain-containing protein [Acidobacteriota bacterium]|nr:carboxypeptidase regulatory-like domain-containing protein [Acidobacteriota bacterium]